MNGMTDFTRHCRNASKKNIVRYEFVLVDENKRENVSRVG